MSSPKRAVNLARVSTPRQAELYSLDYQLDQMRIYDDEIGLTVVAEFKDDVSGRKIERDGLEEACQMLERNEADVLVTWKFDRLHRNYVNSVLLRDRIRSAGKEIHYAQSKTVSGKTARQRLPEDLQYIMAEIEADDIMERTASGKRRKIEQGQKWAGINKPPYGYTAVGRGHETAMVVNEEQASVVRRIFSWYIFGEEKTGPLPVTQIVEKLMILGIPSPQDTIKSRKHLKKRGFAQWAPGSVYRILRESAYGGTFYHYRYTMVNGVRVANKNKKDWRGVPVPRIVEEGLFQAVQEKLDKGKRLSRRSAQEEYLMGRRIRCECGYKMRSTRSTHSHILRDGTPKVYRSLVYRCPGRTKSDQRINRCDLPQVSTKLIDARVWEWVKEDIANPEVLERKLREIQAKQHEENAGKEQVIATLHANKAKLEEELKKLGTLYAKDGMPPNIVDELIAEQGHKLSLTEAELVRLEQELKTPLTDEIATTLIAFSVDFHEHLEVVEQTFVGRRTVIDGLDVNVVVFRKEGELWLRLTSILRPQSFTMPLSPHSHFEFRDP